MGPTLGQLAANLLYMLVDVFCVIWFFHRLEGRGAGCRIRFLGYGSFAFLALIFMTTTLTVGASTEYSLMNFAAQGIRIGLHGCVILGYLYFTKERSLSCDLYLTGMFLVLYQASQNFRIAMLLFNNAFGHRAWFGLAASYCGIPLQLLLIYWVEKILTPEEEQPIYRGRFLLVLLALFMEMYFKWANLTTMSAATNNRSLGHLVFFSVCATFAVVLILILFEQNRRMHIQQRRMEMEQVRMEYEAQNAKRTLQTNDDIRRVYHDMKNHLLAILNMAGEKEELKQYLTDLLPEFEGYETLVQTGNAVVDSLLSEKIQRAAQDEIRFHVCLDLSWLEGMRPVDLIVIFGNALDNAIEAEQKLPEGKERYIYIKSSRFANMVVIRISNQYFGTLQQQGENLLTSKQDGKMHGIGLNNIRRTVQRYEGSVRTEFDNQAGWFDLILMLPDQKNNEIGVSVYAD